MQDSSFRDYIAEEALKNSFVQQSPIDLILQKAKLIKALEYKSKNYFKQQNISTMELTFFVFLLS